MKTLTSLLLMLLLLTAASMRAATPWPMASGNYLETFSDITNWTDNFTSPTAATRWGSVAVNAAGSIPDGVKTTVATTNFTALTTTDGVQRGTVASNLVLLATGNTDNINACAVDLYLDFTGRAPGTLSFDWATIINNPNGDRTTSLRVYATTNGVSFWPHSGLPSVCHRMASSRSA